MELLNKIREFASLGSTYAGIVRLKSWGDSIGGFTAGFKLDDKDENGEPILSINPFKGYRVGAKDGQRFMLVAIALPDEPPKKLKWSEMPYSQRAHTLANDMDFQSFCRFHTEEGAMEFIRHRCGVKSTTEIIPGSSEASEFDRMYSNYRFWMDHERTESE